jgi:branched-chain amino acid transport system substrate-binding protein
MEVAVAMSPYYDFLHLLKTVIEAEKTFEPDKLKRALDNVKNHPGLLGPMTFTATDHTGIGAEQIAMATLVSVKDPRAMGMFRERAK